MKREQAGDYSEAAGMPKSTVEAKMNELEALGINPAIKVVRDALGGTTARVAEQVTAINAERDAEVERAIFDDLLTVAKNLHGQARESAKRLYAARLSSLTDEVVSLKNERDQQADKVVRLALARSTSF